MNIFLFGNGNIPFPDFLAKYTRPLLPYLDRKDVSFTLCDFRGTDTLCMELLKSVAAEVTIFHIGEKPRYLPDIYRTKVGHWRLVGGFQSDAERDLAAMNNCSHFLAVDFNSDEKRKSGTKRNIEQCLVLGKVLIG